MLTGAGTGDLRTTGITTLAANDSAVYALTGSGGLWDRGYDDFGNLGVGTSGVPVLDPLGPVAHRDLPPLAAVSIGRWDSPYALSASGDLYAWGQDRYGLISRNGVGSLVPVLTPRRVLAGLEGPFDTAMVALPDGSVSTWGYDGGLGVYDPYHAHWGILGQGQYGPPSGKPPALVAGLPGVPVSALVNGARYEAALLADGSVYAWGPNRYGELGLADQPIPAPQAGRVAIAGVTELSAHGDHMLALLGDGSLRGWGFNDSGQVGSGAGGTGQWPDAVTTPVPVIGFGPDEAAGQVRVAQPGSCPSVGAARGASAGAAASVAQSGALRAPGGAAAPRAPRLRSGAGPRLHRSARAAAVAPRPHVVRPVAHVRLRMPVRTGVRPERTSPAHPAAVFGLRDVVAGR